MIDPDGTQRTDNVVNPRHRDRVAGGGRGASRRDREYFQVPSATGRPYVSASYVSTATGQLCVTVSVPLRGPDGRLRGILAADVNLSDLRAVGAVSPSGDGMGSFHLPKSG